MKVEIEKCERAQNFCDRRCARAIRTGGESACYLNEVDDGKENLTLTIVDGEERKIYELSPSEQKTIYETSRDLQEFEVANGLGNIDKIFVY